jgi:hypothetical protein
LGLEKEMNSFDVIKNVTNNGAYPVNGYKEFGWGKLKI